MNKIISIFVFAFLMSAGVAQAQEDKTILSDSYIITQEFVSAEVIRVRPPTRTLTVRGPMGKTRQFVVPKGTRITVNGRNSELRNIRPGDRVLVTMKANAERVVIDRIKVPNAIRPAPVSEAQPPVATTMPVMLPKTASNLPALALAGLFSLLGAALIRRRLMRR